MKKQKNYFNNTKMNFQKNNVYRYIIKRKYG